MALKRPIVHVLSTVKDLTPYFTASIPEIQFVSIPANTDDLTATAKCEVNQEQVEYLQKAEVLIGDPLLLGGYVQEMPNLKWMQSTWAGVDGIFNRLDPNKNSSKEVCTCTLGTAAFDMVMEVCSSGLTWVRVYLMERCPDPLPKFPLSKCSGKFGPPMAEFVLCHILAKERRVIDLHEDKKNKKWMGRTRANYRSLPTLSIGILGVGDIGKEVAKKCKAFGMTVWGLVNEEIPKENLCEHVDHYRMNKDLPEVLQSCDYICSILPSTVSTRGILSGDVLSHCKNKKPVFINVGRGDVIDEESIIKALRKGWISYAVLDVFESEPLPKESQLWDEPNVFISPHIAVISPQDLILEVFKENWERYVSGKGVKFVVDWKKGY